MSFRSTERQTPDTAGTSDIIFGLFWLLGYQFSPRLADAGEAVFWRIDKNAHYGALDELARGCVELPKVENHWDEMMRASGSLKLGTIHASELLRSLLRSTRPSALAQAIMEVGRVNKTLYLLHYIDDEDYRRRILTQLNRGEGRHAVARAICYGQRGEIRKQWVAQQSHILPDCDWQHITFTMPLLLWPFFNNNWPLLNALFRAATRAMLRWARKQGVEVGIFCCIFRPKPTIDSDVIRSHFPI